MTDAFAACVELTDGMCLDGKDVPAGASGVIVEDLGAGCYIVEFFTPKHCVATVRGVTLKWTRPPGE